MKNPLFSRLLEDFIENPRRAIDAHKIVIFKFQLSGETPKKPSVYGEFAALVKGVPPYDKRVIRCSSPAKAGRLRYNRPRAGQSADWPDLDRNRPADCFVAKGVNTPKAASRRLLLLRECIVSLRGGFPS